MEFSLSLTQEREVIPPEMFNFKLISLPIFIGHMIFLGGDSFNAPKIGKRKNKVSNINLRGCKTKKNVKGGIVTDKTGLKIFVL